MGVTFPSTRAHTGLLGPCFKTGRRKPLRPLPIFGPSTNLSKERRGWRNKNRNSHEEPFCIDSNNNKKERLQPKASASQEGRSQWILSLCSTHAREGKKLTDACSKSLHQIQPKRWLEILRYYGSSIRFPPNGFKHYFTLFPKFFSSFPRGTCSLSVSCPYLALDEVYHPI